MEFPSTDQLNTLAEAREAYSQLLEAHAGQADELDAVKGDLKAANEMLEEANEKISSLADELNTARESEKQLEQDLAQTKEKRAEADSRIQQLETEAKSAEAKAAEICASVGVDPVQVTPGADEKQADLRAQFEAITDPARKTAFFREHRDALMGN